MTNAEQAEDWISALSAVYRLTKTLLSDEQSKAVILSRLKDGSLDGRADLIVEEADIGQIDFEYENYWEHQLRRHPRQKNKGFFRIKDEGQPLPIVDKNFFNNDDGWVIDTQTISWQMGRIVARKHTNLSKPQKPKIKVVLSNQWPNSDPILIDDSEMMMRRVIAGLYFRTADIDAIFGNYTFESNMDSNEEPITDVEVLPKLPASASPNDHKYKEYAVQAANVMRNEKMFLSEAIRKILPTVEMRENDSIARAIRHSYNLMYDRNGIPHQN